MDQLVRVARFASNGFLNARFGFDDILKAFAQGRLVVTPSSSEGSSGSSDASQTVSQSALRSDAFILDLFEGNPKSDEHRTAQLAQKLRLASY